SDNILAYARIRGTGDRYVLFKDSSENVEVIGQSYFDSDGHPSYSPDKRWILTDTYPDRFRICRLVLYDTQTNRGYDLAKLRSPREFASPRFETNWHCDLHPRWNRKGDTVCFDAAYMGRRSLCTMRVGPFLDALSSRAN